MARAAWPGSPNGTRSRHAPRGAGVLRAAARRPRAPAGTKSGGLITHSPRLRNRGPLRQCPGVRDRWEFTPRAFSVLRPGQSTGSRPHRGDGRVFEEEVTPCQASTPSSLGRIAIICMTMDCLGDATVVSLLCYYFFFLFV